MVYEAVDGTDGSVGLFSVMVDGATTPLELTGGLPDGGRSDLVLYLAAEDDAETLELFGRFLGRARAAGGEPESIER